MRTRGRCWSGWALLLALPLDGCETADAGGQLIRAGAGVGWTATDVFEDPDGQRSNDPALGIIGFTELGVESSDDGSMVIGRALYSDTAHGVDGHNEDARLQQLLLFGLYAPSLLHRGDFVVRPLVGLGVGGASFDYPATGQQLDSSGASLAFALGLECEALDHFTFGAFAYGGLWGTPGETDGSFAQAMLYCGVRF